MALASYQQWKLINENFGLFTLGVATPATVGGVVGSVTDGEDLEEGKKCSKCKSKMDADVEEEPEEEPEDKKGLKEKPEKEPEEEPEEDGEEEEQDDDPDITKKPMLMKKNMKKAMKKMKKEDQEWWASVHDMVLSDPENKSWDGFTRIEEDSLIAPTDPNASLNASEEPTAGEVGYAPQGRIGSL